MARAIRPRGGQDWENRFAYNTVAENADEIEWATVLNGNAHFSAGTADDAIAEAGDEFAPQNAIDAAGDTLQGQEVLQEARQGTVYELIKDRQDLLGAAYPFEIRGNSLVHRASELPIYELLLGICQAPSLTATPYCELPRLFERLSVLAGRGYLGPSAAGYRTGWPRPQEMSHFKALIESLKVETGNFQSEWQWSPAEHLPEDPAPKFVKEEGLDVVVWNKWPDGRTGQLYLLGQCACGKDWLGKDRDLMLEDFTQWFRLPRVGPVRSFFTPRYAVKYLLNELAFKAGLVFDRIRIVQALAAPHLLEEVRALAPEIISSIAIAKQPMAIEAA